MNIKLFSKKWTRLLGLAAFIVTGGGLILSTAINQENLYKTEILIIIGCFFGISLFDHYKKLILDKIKVKINKRSLYIFICSFVGVTLTWFINHQMGYGAVIANGLVGVMAAIFLPNDLAGITYTSSFVGMSSLAVIPSLAVATLGSIIVWLVFLTTAEIYAGIGGKGGTTAALSTIITKIISSIFG
ncbi:hypothetical protein [Tissierella sp. Yu-01]|uniref:hypothetical protein n=1 Tax=Tissierella sp. Yu-01 TaxID=3035694 RepID=UPI00240D62DC|nr:hypothetical protein [Tissierella sp. Yu-01]WFA08887.1 hypothetical protein P3962_14355 [Tissierella sp. Yu-01]